MTQSDTLFRGVLEKISALDTNIVLPRVVSQSVLLTMIAGMNTKTTEMALNKDGSNVLSTFKLKDTFKGDDANIAIDITQSFTVLDELDDLAINYGDGKSASSDRELIHGYLNSMDLGWTVEVTQKERQRLNRYSNLKEKGKKLADYIKASMDRKTRDMGLWLSNQIYFGEADSDGINGVVTRYTDGATRKGLIGLSHICGSSKYMNLSTTNWSNWQGYTYDMGEALFGYTAANLDTIAELIAVPDNQVYTRIFDILRKVLFTAKSQFPGDQYAIIVSPHVYTYIIQPAIDRMKAGNSVQISSAGTALSGVVGGLKGMELDLIPKDGYQIQGAPIVPETAQYNDKYLIPSQYIYVLNLSKLKLEAEESANFVMDGWQKDYTRYGVFQNSLEATLRFYSLERRCHKRIKFDSAVLVELAAIGQDEYTEETT